MEIYLATLENSLYVYENMPDNYIKYGLVSYYYMKDNDETFNLVLDKCQFVLIDSGAHSFQHGAKVDFDDFTRKYINFVKKWTHHPKIVGFFEMDIDNVSTYEKVLIYQKELKKVSEKIIPVWHNNRGIDDFHNMCKLHKNKRVAITGFKNNDIIDSQYNLFINTSQKYGADLHILGMTRFDLMNSLNLSNNDSADSSSWKQTGIFGGINLISASGTSYKLSCLEGLDLSYKEFIKVNLSTAMYMARFKKDGQSEKGYIINE